MRNKHFIIVALLLLSITAFFANPSREIWITEDFSSTTFPPPGWTISSNAANWSRFAGNNAGGTAPELRFSWEPQFSGASYFISPMLDTTGESQIFLDFNHFVDRYATPFTIGVATRSSGGAWNVAWSINPTADVGPEQRTVVISNSNVGSAEFQFAFFFSGSSYNIDFWYIDNIKLYTPFEYDLAIINAAGPSQVIAGEVINPSCVVKNLGTMPLSPIVDLDIYEWDTMIENHTVFGSTNLAPGAEETINFPFFLPTTENEMYRFEFRVSSLEDVIDMDPSNNLYDKWVATWTAGKQNVLLELGTGGWCPYCPGAAMAADEFVALDYNVAVIENHNGDPYANDTSNARNSYYGISGYPTGIFDGVLRYVGGSNSTSIFPSYLPLYQQRAPLKTPVELFIYGISDREGYQLTVRVDKLANLIQSNLVLHLALTESEIPYSWQGQTHFNFVNHIMLPDHLGTPIALNSMEIGYYDYELFLSMGAAWVPEHCELVAFIQDNDTKEVLQAYKISLLALEEPPVSVSDNTVPALKAGLESIHPNPFNPQTTISYSLPTNQKVQLNIYNLKGQLVKSLVDADMVSGRHSIVWNGLDNSGSKVSSGMYFVRMDTATGSSSRKVMLLK
ncbi:MAG: T9SS type A sorting domain-containing protein [Candidatus Cloacimonadaceae bacterium]|nr:T9SS type A sorting domain-containing protein [Candidatus Cloacimonadaceae bacterium]